MRRSLLFQSMMLVAAMVAPVSALQTQQAPPAKSAPPSLSPAMPVAPADPAKLAEPAGTKTPATAPVDVATYVLGAQDQITVSMWNEPKFNGSYTIRPDGKISLELIGEVQATGLTPLQLQDAINKAASAC
jgi:protein involved in polysaccharide export with SLBB domain